MEVTLVDYMGDDIRVVNAARVSFAKESEWENIVLTSIPPINKKILSDKDQKLITYLAKHNHFTPFTHVQITMREKVPIFVARQRFKHTIGFSYNEVSRRYVNDDPEFYIPEVWRSRPEGSVKQGSGKEIVDVIQRHDGLWQLKEVYQDFVDYVKEFYNDMIDNGVAPEQARMVLPQSMMTEYIVTGSLVAWARAYKLRIDAHAQKEIQDLAKLWNEKISNIKELEHSWKALTND